MPKTAPTDQFSRSLMHNRAFFCWPTHAATHHLLLPLVRNDAFRSRIRQKKEKHAADSIRGLPHILSLRFSRCSMHVTHRSHTCFASHSAAGALTPPNN